MFEVKVIADSVSQAGSRITTLSLTYPRFIHSEFLTHRDRARNSASSRAIPWSKMLAAVELEPVVPIVFGSEQKGMQTGGQIDDPAAAERIWLEARDKAVEGAKALAALGVHKSLVNRLVEPWMWITVITTATRWGNFLRLRDHPDAEIHFQKLAAAVRRTLEESVPVVREAHLPFIQEDELGLELPLLLKISTARCARVSYLTHEGFRSIDKDLELFERLVQGSGFGHWSPHEHPALAQAGSHGCYEGWKPYRKMFAQECGDIT